MWGSNIQHTGVHKGLSVPTTAEIQSAKQGRSLITDSTGGDALAQDTDPRSGATQKAYSSSSPYSTGESLIGKYEADPETDPYADRPKKKEDKIHKAKLKAEELKGDTTKVITKYDQKGEPYPKLVHKYAGVPSPSDPKKPISINEMETIEAGLRKQRGGISRKEIAMRKFAERADAQIEKASAEGRIIHVRTVPGEDKQIAPKETRQKTYTANVKRKSLIRQAQVKGQDLTKQVESLDKNIKKSLISGKPAEVGGKPIEIAKQGFQGKKSGPMKVRKISGETIELHKSRTTGAFDTKANVRKAGAKQLAKNLKGPGSTTINALGAITLLSPLIGAYGSLKKANIEEAESKSSYPLYPVKPRKITAGDFGQSLYHRLAPNLFMSIKQSRRHNAMRQNVERDI